ALTMSSGVTWLSVPIWSSLPQRPQFLSFCVASAIACLPTLMSISRVSVSSQTPPAHHTSGRRYPIVASRGSFVHFESWTMIASGNSSSATRIAGSAPAHRHHRQPRVGPGDIGLRQSELLAHDVRAAHQRDHLVVGVHPAHRLP